MNYKFTQEQIIEAKKDMRKKIFFLLLMKDPYNERDFEHIDATRVFDSTIAKINGYNEILLYPTEMISVMALLEAARLELQKKEFNFRVYRKLVLDAGSEVDKIKEV